MSSHPTEHAHHEIAPGLHHDGNQLVHHQYVDAEQQNETYLIGMWTFLITEVMFFGALFLAYILYRWKYQAAFWEVHNLLDVKMGTINTIILLVSSFTMALGVHFAQRKQRKKVMLFLGATCLCAFGFLVVKYFEWSSKFEAGLVPGPGFTWNAESTHALMSGGRPLYEVVPAGVAQMFFSLYYAMTGLHAIHVIVGIIVIGALIAFWAKGNLLVTEDYIPTEMVGLYWHFVDLVWIYLFPLYYLIPR